MFRLLVGPGTFGDVRIFLAGATGVIGVHLLPLLLEAGHQVAGTTRSPHKAGSIESRGAVAVVVDAYDAQRLSAEVVRFEPDVVLHQLTDLPDDPELLPGFRDANARIRTEGTANLVAASRAAGARILAQSIAWAAEGSGGDAVRFHEDAVLEAGGTVLRYGQFHGPGTYFPDAPPPPPRVGVVQAAIRTVEALDHGPGIVEIVDSAPDGSTDD